MTEASSLFDIIAEIDRFFSPSSINTGPNRPQCVILAGGTGAGKTRLRRERYAMGYVVLDAADIFVNLCRRPYLDFPGPLEEPMELVGHGVARRLFKERRHFVTEIIGASCEPTKQLIDTVKSAGYHCELVDLTCDVQVAWERNVNRSENNISAYYAEKYHYRWVYAGLAAAK